MSDLKLDIAFWNYDPMRALADGTIKISGVASFHSARIAARWESGVRGSSPRARRRPPGGTARAGRVARANFQWRAHQSSFAVTMPRRLGVSGRLAEEWQQNCGEPFRLLFGEIVATLGDHHAADMLGQFGCASREDVLKAK